MPSLRSANFGFTRGYLSPDAADRSDIDVYPYGFAKGDNYFVLPQGPVAARHGFEFIKDIANAKWFSTFKFTDQQEYLFVWYAAKLEIYRNDVLAFTDSSNIPYSASDVLQIDTLNVDDTLFVYHQNHEPISIFRDGSHTDWIVSEVSYDNTPFAIFHKQRSLTPSATTGAITLTLAAGTDYWIAEHVGVQIKINDGLATITSISTGLVANATVDDNLANTTASTIWEEDAWSDVHGWPRCGTYHQDRIVVGGTTDLPASYWGTNVGDLFNYDYSETTAQYAYAYRTDSNQSNVIKRLIHAENLVVFTDADEVIAAGDINPESVPDVRTQTSIGSGNIKPIDVEDQTLFLDKAGKAIWAFKWDTDRNKFVAENLCDIANDLISDPVDMAYLKSYKNTQGNLLLIVNADGNVICLSFNAAKRVNGFSKWTTDGDVKSVAVVENSLYLLIERSHGTYMEKMTDDAIFLDHFYSETNTNGTDTWTMTAPTLPTADNLYIVGGESVTEYSNLGTISLDGSSVVTTTEEEKFIAVGMHYDSELHLLPIAFDINGQNMRGEDITVESVQVKVKDTSTLTIEGELIPLGEFGVTEFGQDVARVTKIIERDVSKDGNEVSIIIKREEPLPQQINSVTTIFATGMP